MTVYCSLYLLPTTRPQPVGGGQLKTRSRQANEYSQEAHLLVNLDNGLFDEDLNALPSRANENVVDDQDALQQVEFDTFTTIS